MQNHQMAEAVRQ